MAGPPLSVIDIGIIAPGRDGAEVLQSTLDYATAADRLGYRAFWIAEHHEAYYVWTVPAVMIAALAQRTRRIRLGSAAVLLPLYSPLAVAETYTQLQALSPDRIDLGVAGGIPFDKTTAAALLDGQPPLDAETFPRKLGELARYLRRDFPEDHRFFHGPTPRHATAPPLWVMGTSETSAGLAARTGAHYAYSLYHHYSREAPSVARAFRDAGGERLRFAIAVSCICDDDPDAVEAQRVYFDSLVAGDMRVIVAGRPEECREQILSLIDRYGPDEVILFHLWHYPERRLAALQALAEAFRLPAADR